ncbi:MAG: 4-hydroxybutyrate CoA-transferase [Gammaproteobacteria bacterium]|nr:4-hydroxybutyrate CoA-transferase [Gammaproteobacteria bacterium]
MKEDMLRRIIKPGSSVYVSASSSEPVGIISEIASRKDVFSDIRWIQFPLGAINRWDLSELGNNSTLDTFFMTPFLKEGLIQGRVNFIPMHMRNIFDFLLGKEIDVAILQGARDIEGVLRFGPNVDFLDAVLESAKEIILEENKGFVAPKTCPEVELDRISLIVSYDGAKPVYPVSEIDAVSEKIGHLVSNLIFDGDCIQTGIGSVPAAILSNLTNHDDLGFHGGLIDDALMALIKNGNVNGARKKIDRGKHVVGMALGSEEMLDWLATSKKADNVWFKSANYTHEINVIREIENFVSINSAIQVDLMGQVNAEVVNARQISGTGGSVDFMRSSRASKGGRSIVAMSATARDGKVSKIVPKVESVTALRTDIDLVVTEFGVADIRNDSLKDRASKLIEISDPSFREMLTDFIN